MEKTLDKLLEANPATRSVVRAFFTLRSMIGNPDLAAAEPEIKLAACHIEEAIDELVAAMDSNQ